MLRDPNKTPIPGMLPKNHVKCLEISHEKETGGLGENIPCP